MKNKKCSHEELIKDQGLYYRMINGFILIITGGIIEKDGKFLLVQEAQEKVYGKCNIPAGHLDFN